jgi:hypothetical protein
MGMRRKEGTGRRGALFAVTCQILLGHVLMSTYYKQEPRLSLRLPDRLTTELGLNPSLWMHFPSPRAPSTW